MLRQNLEQSPLTRILFVPIASFCHKQQSHQLNFGLNPSARQQPQPDFSHEIRWGHSNQWKQWLYGQKLKYTNKRKSNQKFYCYTKTPWNQAACQTHMKQNRWEYRQKTRKSFHFCFWFNHSQQQIWKYVVGILQLQRINSQFESETTFDRICSFRTKIFHGVFILNGSNLLSKPALSMFGSVQTVWMHA